MERAAELLFYVNGRKVIEKNVDPETMLLPYLRKKRALTTQQELWSAPGVQ